MLKWPLMESESVWISVLENLFTTWGLLSIMLPSEVLPLNEDTNWFPRPPTPATNSILTTTTIPSVPRQCVHGEISETTPPWLIGVYIKAYLAPNASPNPRAVYEP